MTNPMPELPKFTNILKHVITDIIEDTAVEDTALSDILNLTYDIVQKAKIDSINLEEFISLNESANNIIWNITKAQMMNRFKLQHFKKLIQTLEDLTVNTELHSKMD